MLFKRNSIYYAVINIPKSLVPVYHRKQIWQSLQIPALIKQIYQLN